ncbi:transcription antitermination factor NusB [Planctomicrobium sp. SH668]|uniref:transcription antitermination factor NusB n=1 Tax=Planctomicrobium sp. SH668 TaxID=3448126 RepID=UPI003F5B3B4D
MPDRPLNPWHGKKVASFQKQFASQPANSRLLALQALMTFQREGIFVAKTLDEQFQNRRTPVRDRRTATELASETVRRKISLDAVLKQFVVRGRESVEDDLWLLLQLGACQLLCLQHIPTHAAVHETVALCEDLGKPRAKGFINGTLRGIEREIIRQRADSPEDSAKPSLQSLTLESLSEHLWPIVAPRGDDFDLTIVEVARPIFTSPATDPVEYISFATSLPSWLISRWYEQFGDYNKILALGLWFTTPGRMALRVNLQRSTREQVLETLSRAEVNAVPGPLPESILLTGSTSVAELDGFEDGHFSVQDLSAMSAGALLDPKHGESILDLCAAPGGKTCHMAERMEETGRVVACDISPDRLRTIDYNIRRLQLNNVETFGLPVDNSVVPPGPFHAVLVDVPCSNSGVLGKRPEARWRMSPESFTELIPLQKKLLNQALDCVQSGGRVVYSTCSIDREENEEVVQAVLASRSDATLVSQVTHWPGSPADGGFQALIKKS